jgi:hypothetical protein
MDSIFKTFSELKIGQAVFEDLATLLSVLTSIVAIIANATNWTINLIFGGLGKDTTAGGEALKTALGNWLAIAATTAFAFFKWGSTAGLLTVSIGLIFEVLEGIKFLTTGEGTGGFWVACADAFYEFLVANDYIESVKEGILIYLREHPILEWIVLKLLSPGGVEGYKEFSEIEGFGTDFADSLWNAIDKGLIKLLTKVPFLSWLIGKLVGQENAEKLDGQIKAYGFADGISDSILEAVYTAIRTALSLVPFLGWLVNLLLSDTTYQDITNLFNKGKELGGAISSGIQSGIGTIDIPVAATITGITGGKGLVGLELGKYATGGFIEDGIFTMNKGEMAGDFSDGTSVVANNKQIVQGIRQGVYDGVSKAMKFVGGGGDVYMDGNKVGKVVENKVYNEGVRVGHFVAKGV